MRAAAFILHPVLLVVLFLSPAPIRAAVIPTHLWSQKFGSTSTDRVNGVAVDASGNVLITGSFFNTVNFGGINLVSAGSADIFIAKYNSLGVHQWSYRFGSTGPDTGSDVTVDASGNVYFTGDFEGSVAFGGATLTSAGGDDIFLVKYSDAGAHVWSVRFGGAGIDAGTQVVIDGAGNGYVAGNFRNTVDFGGGNRVSAGSADIFLLKFNSLGGHMISQGFGSTTLDDAQGLAVDSFDNVVLTGYFNGTVNFGGGNLIGAGGNDIIIAKYDNVLNGHLWSQRFGGANSDVGEAVAIDANDDVIAVGSFQASVSFGGPALVSAGSSDVYMARFNSAGVHEWSHRFGGTNSDAALDVALDPDGDIVMSGNVTGGVDFGGGVQSSGGTSHDVFLAKYTGTGAYRWSLVAGGSSVDDAFTVATDASGNVVTGGQFGATMNLGGSDLVASAASVDCFLGAFAENGLSPLIDSVTDIGNDQGRHVKVRFVASGKDEPTASPEVLTYEVYRRDDAPPALAAGNASLSQRRLRDDGWTFVGSTPAHEKDSYALDVPTIADSTIALGPYVSTFFVRAAGADPAFYFDSPPGGGYSLDNLAPGVPSSLMFTSGDLAWEESTAADFDYFTVYGANTNSFAAAVLVDYTVAPTMDVSSTPYVFYFVTATDFSGNEGKPAKVNTLSGVGGTPKSFVLSVSNYPNPFNPRTTVSYTVPSRGRVSVGVYDVRGAVVATLFDGERDAGAYSVDWDARSENADVASGIYFARVFLNGATRSKKMILLK